MVKIINIPLPNNSVAYKKAGYRLYPEIIVIHNTANKTNAKDEINYMHSTNDYRSFHFAVDESEAVQGIDLDKNTWHAGDGEWGVGNRKGISIEICRSYVPKIVNGKDVGDEEEWRRSYKTMFEKAQENAAELTAYLLNKYGWGCDLSRIKKHQDFDGKYCPRRTLSEYGWEWFLSLVKQKYEEMYLEGKPMTASERKEFEALKAEVASLKKTVDLYERQDVYTNAATIWNYIDSNLPVWATPTIKKLVTKGYLKGNENGELELSYIMLRIVVLLDRAGMFGK